MTTPAETVITAVRGVLGDRLSVNHTVREQHSRGEDTTTPTLPDAVAFVETTAEVSRILALCHQHGVAVTPFGAGTSLEGHVNPVRAGVSLDLSRMKAVLELNEEDMDCLIEPGVTRQDLNAFLRDKGFGAARGLASLMKVMEGEGMRVNSAELLADAASARVRAPSLPIEKPAG